MVLIGVSPDQLKRLRRTENATGNATKRMRNAAAGRVQTYGSALAFRSFQCDEMEIVLNMGKHQAGRDLPTSATPKSSDEVSHAMLRELQDVRRWRFASRGAAGSRAAG